MGALFVLDDFLVVSDISVAFVEFSYKAWLNYICVSCVHIMLNKHCFSVKLVKELL